MVLGWPTPARPERRRRLFHHVLTGAPGGGGAGGDPEQISSTLSGWWDAEDDGTIVQSGGRLDSIENQLAVSVAPKRYESSGIQRPFIVTVDGHQMIDFRSANATIAGDDPSNSVLQPGAGDFTLFALCRIDVGVQAGGVTWLQRDGAGVELWQLNCRNSVVFSIRDAAGDLASILAADESFADGSTRWVFIGLRDGDDLRLYYGSGSQPLVESSASPADASLVGDVDAVNSALGNFPDTQPAGNYWDGELGEWGMYVGLALSESQRLQLYQYLVNKWEL